MTKLFVQFAIPLSVLAPILIGAFYYRRFFSGMRIILHYLAIGCIFNLFAVVLSRNNINNMPLLHIYTIVEFACCALFFRSALEGMRIAKIISYLIAAFTLFSIFNVCFLQDIFSFNSYSRSLEALLLIVFCLFFFYKLLGAKAEVSQKSLPLLCICIGFFFYFSGSLFLFLFPEFEHAGFSIYQLAWLIHSLLVLLMYIFFSVAFYLSRRLA